MLSLDSLDAHSCTKLCILAGLCRATDTQQTHQQLLSIQDQNKANRLFVSHRSWNSNVSPPVTLLFIRTSRRKRKHDQSSSGAAVVSLQPSAVCFRAERILPTNVNLLLSVSPFHLFTNFINFQTRISFCSRHTAQVCISCMQFASQSVLTGLQFTARRQTQERAAQLISAPTSADGSVQQ